MHLAESERILRTREFESTRIVGHAGKEWIMLRWSILFLVVALIAGALGMFRVEFISSQIAWVLFVVFLILFLVSLALGRRAPPPA